MYKVISEEFSLKRNQFNSGSRGIEITMEDGGDPIYATVHLPAEGAVWEGQRQIGVEIYARPSSPVRILVNAPETPWEGTYSDNEYAKKAAMTKALDELCEQTRKWVYKFVYTKPANAR